MADKKKQSIHDEIDMVVSTKSKEDDYCWACGPVGEFQHVGDRRYMIQAVYDDTVGNEIFEYIELCPKHLAFLMTVAFTHVMRGEKGKEEGPLNLAMLQGMAKGL